MRPAISPWRLGGLSFRELQRRVYGQLWKDEVFDRAAGLSYYFLLALFPTLLFLTALLGLLPFPRLMDQLMIYAARVLPGDAASLVTRTLAEIVLDASGELLSIGVVAADRKSTRLNSSHGYISYAVFCLKKKRKKNIEGVMIRQ